ncbi:nose resistant to fluoxetine protein 6-like [Amphibalanus amphitrite]|uniref:nose resistant to fluoxetine protein 6-like n=1 Tax=Amphibalanus amphitrite TaxID=1232801 RepID=UPI001C90E60D|nr:nose resistant to fluoxetine protein 6-like [Amphibalanus amphitrite]
MGPKGALLTALCLVVGLGCAQVSSELQYGSIDDWRVLDHWGTVLKVRREFDRKNVLEESPLDVIRNATQRPGVPRTMELEVARSEAPSDSTSVQYRQRRDEAIARAIGPFITPVANEHASLACQASSLSYLRNIFKEIWALKMFDATGKLPDGVLLGNVNPFGNWDECLNTTGYYTTRLEPDTVSRQASFAGKYCLAIMSKADGKTHSPPDLNVKSAAVDLAPILPVLPYQNAYVGMCIPSTCSGSELAAGLNAALSGVTVSVPDYLCYTQDEETTFTAGDIVMIVICSLTALLMIVGTVIDVVAVQAAKKPESWLATVNEREVLPGTLRQVFLAFSVYTNGKKLLDTSSTRDTLGCLHGIRFFSNTWVILGHTYFFLVPFKHQNITKLLSFFGNLGFLTITDATVSVDTFFLLSGLLVSYSVMRSLDKTNGKFNILMFYVHRYIRLTPVMMMVIGFVSTLYLHLGTGPFWGVASQSNPLLCQQKWWMNMLYVNNIDGLEEQCLGQTWYLANDMQMFLFSPLVLLPLFHWPVLGQLWLIFLVCFFTGINAMVTVTENLGPTGALPGTDGDSNMRYEKPWTRFGPYLVGLYMGWVLHKIRGRKIVLPAPVVAIGWLTASLTGCLIVYGLYDQPTVPPEATSVIYAMLSRTAWSVAVAWVVFACVTGHGGVVDSLLSWKAFIPLSRLTYTSYLVSIDVQLYYYYTNKSPLYLDQLTLVYIFIGSVPVIFTVAAIFSLAFESPMISLEKLIFPQASKGAAAKPKPVVPESTAKPEQDASSSGSKPGPESEVAVPNGSATKGAQTAKMNEAFVMNE